MTESGESSLAGIDLLSGLSPAERREIEQACSWKRFVPPNKSSTATANPGASI